MGILGVALLVAGGYQLMLAAKCTFLANLDPEAGRKRWVKWLGRFGYAARGVVFLLCGYFLGRSALDAEPSEAGGMERALDWLSSPVETLVATGLLLFGAYSLVEALYRRIPTPPIEQAAEKIARTAAP